MDNKEINEFAKSLVKYVRDTTLRECSAMLEAQAASPVAQRWKGLGVAPERLSVVIPDVIDETIFNFLQAIDQGLLRVAYKSSSGQAVDLTESGQGELSGWYMGSGGWRAMFSEEPYADDFSDLAG